MAAFVRNKLMMMMIVTKISFATFSARRGPPTPKGEKTRPDPGYARTQNMA